MAPVERFLAIEAASGILLLAAALLALLWANSPWAGVYVAGWEQPVGPSVGEWGFVRPLRWWVNDGLMTVFFFVVGLEIRREMHQGELAELRRAALPMVAAVGGMLLPALCYAALNWGRASAVGWGVPMATDIAFAVGVLALLGDRVPPALRILLLALAVIDDLGAILVIAFFYSGGVHPAVAGVVLGLLVPARAAPGRTSPVVWLEQALHGWVAYIVMPLFALANAGVPLGDADLGGDGGRVFAGTVLGLVVGKVAGIVGFSRAATALGITRLPGGVGWPQISVVGLVGGIGFTMALFLAQLAFPPGPLLETAKLAILTGSTVAGVLGWLVGRVLLAAPSTGR